MNTRRKHDRLAASLEARFWRDGAPVPAQIANLSLGGAFVETAVPPGVGTKCLVEFRPSLGAPAVQVSAVVRWVGLRGMGLEWSALRAGHVRALQAALQSIGASGEPRSVPLALSR